MPGGNTLVVHMKDRKKSRIKKRWSQVMYMYFLLGFRLMGRFQSKLLETMTQDKRGRTKKAISREDGMFFKVKVYFKPGLMINFFCQQVFDRWRLQSKLYRNYPFYSSGSTWSPKCPASRKYFHSGR